MHSSQIDERSWINQPFDPQRAAIWKAGFVITALCLSIITGLYAQSFNLTMASTLGALIGASSLGAILCHFKGKKIGYENAWFIVIASLVTIIGLQGAILNQYFTPNHLTDIFVGLAAGGFVLTTAAIFDRTIKENSQRKALLKFLITCYDGDFIKAHLDAISEDEAKHLMMKGALSKNNELVLALMEKGFRNDQVFVNAIVYQEFKNDQLALLLLQKDFKQDGYEDWALQFAKDENLRKALIQKREERVNKILKSNCKEFIFNELTKIPGWDRMPEFMKRVIKEGTHILKKTLFDMALYQQRYFDDVALTLLEGGFEPFAECDTKENKIKALNSLIEQIKTHKPETEAWAKVCKKLVEYGNKLH